MPIMTLKCIFYAKLCLIIVTSISPHGNQGLEEVEGWEERLREVDGRWKKRRREERKRQRLVNPKETEGGEKWKERYSEKER